MNISDFELWLKDNKSSYLTVKNYSSQISKFFNDDKTKEKYKGDISFFPQYLSEMPVPIRKYAIKRYLEFLQEKGQNVNELLEKIKPISASQGEREEIQTLERERGIILIKHLLKKEKIKLALICMIIYDTAVRVRAVLKLRKRNLEYMNGEAYLNFSEKRKKKITRLITGSTLEYFKEFSKDKDDDSYLFFEVKKLSDEAVDDMYIILWSDLKTESRGLFGTMGISFHWMRRGSAADIYRRTGNDLVAASEQLGHSGTDMTKRYLKLQAEKAKDVIRSKKDEW